MRPLCLSVALLVLLVILVDTTPLNIHHIQDEGLETNHTRELEKRSVVNVIKSVLGGVITGTKIIGDGASILTGLAEIINKALKGQVMISGIQFDNHAQEELPTLEIEYSTLSEEIKGVETIHKQGIEKRSVLPVVKGILGGVLKGVKVVGKGASILTGLAEIVKNALKGQVMISRIQFDNHTPEELPTLEIEYSTLSEENEGVETSHKHGLEKRSVKKVFKKILGGVIKGSKIVGNGASILGGLAKMLNKTIRDEVMISRIQFDNHTQEELPTLEIEYAVLSEENKGVETSHKQRLEKRAVLPVLKGILGGVLKGAKVFGKGASIITGLAEIVKKALKGQVMISGIQFDNSTQEEMPTLQIEYSTLIEENEGVETIHKQGIEKRSVLPVVKGILGGVLKGVKIVGKGASILTGLAEIVKKALKGQVMISGIQFDNSTQEELPTLEIEYSTLSEEIKGVETIHKQGIEKRSVLPVVKGILGGVLKGVKIVGKGTSILTGLAEIVKKALKGQVMISGIQFDNHSQEELPTLEIEYSTLIEENKGQVMISGIQFDNHTQEELPTLEIEYSTLSEENKGVETSQKRVLEKRSVVHVVKSILGGVIKGTKIFGKGASILTGLAEIVTKALKGQVMISGIQFENHMPEELPTLNMEYSTLNEENKGQHHLHQLSPFLDQGLDKCKCPSTREAAATAAGRSRPSARILKGQPVRPQHPQESSCKATKMRRLCLSTALLFLLVILVDSTPLNIHHIQDEGLETSHRRGPEKRSVIDVATSIIDGIDTGTKIVKKGAGILTGLAETITKAIKGQVMISRIQFDNHTLEELPTLNIEYSTLSEENNGVETSHRRGLEKRSVIDVVTSIINGVATGQVMISRIQFDNHTLEELPTLSIEYSTLSEENKGVETSHRRGPVKRSVIDVVTSIINGVATGTKIVEKGAGILTGLAEIITKAIKGQVMISGIQFDNHTLEEYQTLKIEYSTLNEENKAASKPAFCLEPKVTGGCNATMTRYFYNAQTGLCEQFVYGGCEGNGNNFEKLEDCMKTCSQEAGSLW
ncbi:hypothetical protein R6Z07M_012577 [Ovis aries]